MSPAAVELIRLVDKNTYTTESGFFDKVAYCAGIRVNPDAKMIKVADVRDNTAPWRLSYLPQETQTRLIKKYDDTLDQIGA